ncbi:MAG: DUF1295 domain-containing protein [Anaerolineales bacterium]|jgi:protein-S-isoprenylcysteine O-methyltransferase Ste14
MTPSQLFEWLIVLWIVMAAGVFVVLFFFNAPYGRHARRGWGPTIDNRLGWALMEGPAPILFTLCFLLSPHPRDLTAYAFLLMWQAHYVHRAFIYPFSLRGRGKRMPVVILALAMVFNASNTLLIGYDLFVRSGPYGVEWLKNPKFLLGLGVFVAGFTINRHADRVLRNLRAPGESGYRLPTKGLYRWISCPNYLGEITEWIGWAIATWSLSGLAFAVWTFANLAPRARAHHQWYREHFSEYPAERKALVPLVW